MSDPARFRKEPTASRRKVESLVLHKPELLVWGGPDLRPAATGLEDEAGAEVDAVHHRVERVGRGEGGGATRFLVKLRTVHATCSTDNH